MQNDCGLKTWGRVWFFQLFALGEGLFGACTESLSWCQCTWTAMNRIPWWMKRWQLCCLPCAPSAASSGLLLVLNGWNCKSSLRPRIDLNGLNTSKALRPNQPITIHVSSSVDVSGFSRLSVLDLTARVEVIKILNHLRGKKKNPTKQKLLMSLKPKQCFLGRQQEASGNVSRARFLLSKLLFKWNKLRSAQGHQGVEAHTCPGATRASGCFFLTRICQGFRCSACHLQLGKQSSKQKV